MAWLDFYEYLPQLMSVSVIAVFMAISPGADFVMISRNSIFFSRRAGLFSSLGVSMAIWIHVAYSIAGLAVIISKSVILFSVIKYLGAAYLIYIGWQTFKSNSNLDIGTAEGSMGDFKAFKVGFVTNALNPKTPIFFSEYFYSSC